MPRARISVLESALCEGHGGGGSASNATHNASLFSGASPAHCAIWRKSLAVRMQVGCCVRC